MYKENDYIMRIIHECIRMLMKLLTGMDIDREEREKIPEEILEQYLKLKQMVDDGEIDQAENLLLENQDPNNLKLILVMAA